MATVSSSDLHALARAVTAAGNASTIWPDTMSAITTALGVAGAGLFSTNKMTRRVDWARFTGLSGEVESRFVDYYAHLDPFVPLLGESQRWRTLTKSFSSSFLRRSEWYNDFLLDCGIVDIHAICLLNTQRRSVFFGFHQERGTDFSDYHHSVAEKLTRPLASAAQGHLKNLYGRSHNGSNAFYQPAARYFFDLSNGRDYRDYVGAVFVTPEEATRHAKALAAQLSEDKGWKDFLLTIRNEDGLIVLSIPVRM